jgi:hypothetical protein
MTVNNATGYYNNGEVEDYQVFVDGVLPVDLLSFKAFSESRAVKLEWTAENETNTGNYQVERSANAIDWQAIDAISARNLPGIQSYTTRDNMPLGGKSYYRLKILNNLGAEEKYSETREVERNGQTGFVIVIAPNPVKNKLQLAVRSASSSVLKIQIVDVKGRILLQAEQPISSGMNELVFNEATRWPPGIYYLVCSNGSEISKQSFTLVQ